MIADFLLEVIIVELVILSVLRISTHKRTKKWLATLDAHKAQTEELIQTIGGFTKACESLKQIREEIKHATNN